MKQEKTQTIEEQTLDKAIEMIKAQKPRKFAESVDLDFVLKLKESQKKETARGVISFPNKFGVDKKVVVICDEKDTKDALAAGAVKAGADNVIDEISKGFMDFDVLVATPVMMPKVARLGKLLGPRGMMPNPANGSVSDNPAETVKGFISGKAGFKMDGAQAAVRLKIASVSMDADKIKENALTAIKAVYQEIKKFGANPIKKLVIKSSMGSSIRVNFNDIIKEF